MNYSKVFIFNGTISILIREETFWINYWFMSWDWNEEIYCFGCLHGVTEQPVDLEFTKSFLINLSLFGKVNVNFLGSNIY